MDIRWESLEVLGFTSVTPVRGVPVIRNLHDGRHLGTAEQCVGGMEKAIGKIVSQHKRKEILPVGLSKLQLVEVLCESLELDPRGGHPKQLRIAL